MAELIERSAVLHDLESLWDYSTVDGITASTVLAQVKTDVRNAPAVDAVEVVRCIDCKHCEFDQTEEFLPDGGSNFYQNFGCKRIRELTGEWCEVYVDGYCDRGERKDGKDEA